MNEITKGPWETRDLYEGTIPIDAWDGEESIEICRVSNQDGNQRINSRAISLVPDMVEALENALTSIKRHGLWPIGPNGKPIIGNNTVRTVNEGLVIIDKIETILTKLKGGE